MFKIYCIINFIVSSGNKKQNNCTFAVVNALWQVSCKTIKKESAYGTITNPRQENARHDKP